MEGVDIKFLQAEERRAQRQAAETVRLEKSKLAEEVKKLSQRSYQYC